MDTRYKRIGAALCAALLLSGGEAMAEEKRIGDLIYVPAMTVQAESGTYALRVEGLMLEAGSDEPARVEALAGAEFGVYVLSSSGEVTAWANPLYPSEPMRIRTGEGDTRFSLPQGLEFYLRQESAPEGYLYDAQALIPVTGEQIVVRNTMAGQLVITAKDSLGEPVGGVSFTVISESGGTKTLISDEKGQAAMSCAEAGVYRVEESSLPEGVYEAIDMTADRASDVVTRTAHAISVSVSDATRTRVSFEHPASGSVQLSMKLAVIGEDGQTQERPLAGVHMDILCETPVSLVTDEEGMAQAALMEGQYVVRFACDADVILPVSEGLMIVESGSTTMIDLTATQTTGRVAVCASAARAIEGASMTLVAEATGELFGPYALDGGNEAVSAELAPGAYRVTVEAPRDMQLGALSCGENDSRMGEALLVEVSAGQLTQVQAELLTLEKQTFELLTASVAQNGETQYARAESCGGLELIDEAGSAAGHVQAEAGFAAVEALSGEYRLRMDEETAKTLDVQALSEPFMLPNEQGTVVFAGLQARLILSGADENGTPVSGAVYAVTDASGARFEVTADESGEAVTPLLSAGEAKVETLTAPEEHDGAATQTVLAEAGKAARVQLVHERYGSASFSVRMQRLDERGEPSLSVLSGASVRITTDDGQEAALLTAGEDGLASVRLEAGEYLAEMDSVGEACRTSGAVRFTVENTQDTQVELLCYDVLGGVGVELVGGELSDEELAQVRFVLVAQDGTTTRLARQRTGFYAGELAEGAYTLSQTQMPQGYTLGAARSVTVVGGQAVRVSVPLEEYAVLSVAKSGLTFNDSMQTYVVPLTGEYGVYVKENGEMKPYPSAEAQMTVWSNVTPEQIARGRAAQLRLPAALEGTTYYVKELSMAQGFAPDETYHEAVLTAGGEMTIACTVSSDRGFFSLDQLDAATGDHVSGGAYELVDAQTQETVLAFEMPEAAYRNPMAIAVGRYILRQTQAAPGYALSGEAQIEVEVEPYLTQGGKTAAVSMVCARVPQTEQMDMIDELYAAQEQGLTLVCASGGSLQAGETLVTPQMTLTLHAQDATRLDVMSVQLDGAGDSAQAAYVARVEYCLSEGGWQPSDARMTQALSSPAVVSLSDVEDDICAVRVTYLDAETGEEIAREGFTPGRVTLDVRADAEDAVHLEADASFTGKFVYALALHGETQVMERGSSAQIDLEAVGSGRFDTVPAGRDGRVTGVAFFDSDADGRLDAAETGRYAGMTVRLISQQGDEVESCRTDAQGRFGFDSISAGTYTVRFDAPEAVALSKGTLYSAQSVSGVRDTRYGESGEMIIDGDHTDYVVNAGCLYAAQVGGTLNERLSDGTLEGFGGLSVEMRAVGADADEEPLVVLTDETGRFRLTGILPGEYEVSIALPEDTLCDKEQEGRISASVVLNQGDEVDIGAFTLEKAASVFGSVRVDDDGDGSIGANARQLDGVAVKLLRISEGHSEQIAQTVTNAQGAYAFEGLASGEYSVLFELSGDWAFTRYGEDSLVYGAAAASGSTESFTLMPGERLQNVNAGVTIPALLTVSVFKDTQYDGQKGVYEEMLADVVVSLIRIEGGEDAQKMTCVTGEDGLAIFDSVSPGEYVIEYQMPDAWRATRQVDPQTTTYPVSCVPQSTLATGRSETFALAMGEKDARLYIGAMLSGSISGSVYYDDDANAARGESESGCAGALAELLNAHGEVQEQRTVGEDGVYAFEGLAPGRYTVRFTAGEGCGFSATERTMVRSGVQQSDDNVSATRPITVSSGIAVTTANAGVVRLGSVAGRIWIDSDANSEMDAGENALADVEVALMNGTGRNILATTQTDESGAFAFEAMRPGAYLLRVSAPDGYVFSGALAGSPLPVESERDGRAYSKPFTLLGGAHVEGIGYGLFTQSAVEGRVWVDEDYDGVMGEAENGLRGAVLAIYTQEGTQVAKTTSQRTGEFSFAHLAPGMYSLKIELPEGYVYTREGGDSVVAHSMQTSQTLSLGTISMGQTIDGVQIGALEPASVGGVVWMDEDNDGRRQPGDAGVSGVQVTMTSGEGEATAVTDETGAYRFDGVMPGDHVLRFELQHGQAFAKQISGKKRVSCVPQTDALSASSGTFAVASGASMGDMDAGVVRVGTIDGSVWEDSAYDGVRGGNERGVPGVQLELIDMTSGEAVASAKTDEEGYYFIDFVRTGEYTVQATLPDGMIFTCNGESAVPERDDSVGATASFTLAMGEGREGLHVGAIVPASVNGTLYVDAHENGAADEHEAGLEGAMVTLMQGGTIVSTCETDDNGAYAFEAVRPGEYRVRVTLPEKTLFVRDTMLTLADPDATEGETPAFEMSMGQHAVIEPLGTVLSGAISGIAWADENANGKMGRTEAPLVGTKVELLAFDAQGSGGIIASTEVDENGVYAFDDLRSGTYALRVTLPEGMLFADCLDVDGGSCVPVVEGNVGMTGYMTLAMGERLTDIHIGGIKPGKIGDSVWLDSDGNGLQDYREPLIAGVELYLLRMERDGSTREIARTVSDAYGYYHFTDLRPGAYVVGVQPREGDTLTYHFGEPLGEIDSDLDPETGRSGEIALGSGQSLRSIDVGLTEHGQ